jgi:uncharacterized protein (TIGR03083 family)
MAMSREKVSAGYLEELNRFTELVRSLDDTEWKTPTRCDGWTTADVTAHVTGTITDILEGRFEGLGSPEVTEREVVERRGRGPTELADELEGARSGVATMLGSFDDAAWDGPPPPGVPGTVGDGVETLLFDTYMHADDIRAAIGRPSEPGGPGLDAAMSHLTIQLTDQGWGPATLALDGYDKAPIGGGGDAVQGDAHQFVLVATGRGDPASFGLGPDVNVYR